MHLLLILFLVLLIFGPGKLPEAGTNLGKAIREFKKAMNEDEPAPVKAEAKNDKRP